MLDLFLHWYQGHFWNQKCHCNDEGILTTLSVTCSLGWSIWSGLARSTLWTCLKMKVTSCLRESKLFMVCLCPQMSLPPVCVPVYCSPGRCSIIMGQAWVNSMSDFVCSHPQWSNIFSLVVSPASLSLTVCCSFVFISAGISVAILLRSHVYWWCGLFLTGSLHSAPVTITLCFLNLSLLCSAVSATHQALSRAFLQSCRPSFSYAWWELFCKWSGYLELHFKVEHWKMCFFPLVVWHTWCRH